MKHSLSQLVIRPTIKDLISPFLRIFLPLGILAFLVLLFFFEGRHHSLSREVSAIEAARLREAATGLTAPLAGSVATIAQLASEIEEQLPSRQMSTDTADSLEELSAVMSRFLRFQSGFFQARLLSATGRELLRFERRNDQIVRISADELQDKSKRYYFQDVIGLRPGQLYLSRLDLNVEHGRLESPNRPTIRLAQPVFNSDNTAIGVVVTNLEASHLFTGFDALLAGVKGQAMWLDSEGFWLRAANREDEWGFIKGNSDLRFGHRFPEAWKAVGSKKQGQFESDEMGLVTFATVEALPDAGPVRVVGRNGTSNLGWKLVSVIPASTLATVGDNRRLFTLATALCLLILFGFSILVAAALVRQTRSEEMLHAAARVTELSNQAILFLDGDRQIEAVNHAFSAITGWLPAEVLGKGVDVVRSGLSRDTVQTEQIAAALARSRHWTGEVWHLCKDGTAFPSQTTILTVESDSSEPRTVEMFSDPASAKLAEPEPQSVTGLDPTTNLPGRRLFMDRLEQAIGYCKRENRRFIFAQAEILGIQDLRRRVGRRADTTLSDVADRLRHTLQAGETAAHLGQGTFGLILFTQTDKGAKIDRIAATFEAALEEANLHTDHALDFSLLTAEYPEDGTSVAALIRRAVSTAA